MFDLSIFTTAEAWISLLTLVFLEIVLGVDNIVFISLTTARLDPEKQRVGRKLGLAGAMVSRIAFLSVASFFVHLTGSLFVIDFGFWSRGVSVRDVVLLAGGAYLIYKGATELASCIRLEDADEAVEGGQGGSGKRIGLSRAVGIIMVMDVVFSVDSVITAVGLADHLVIMVMAVVAAILIMMAFIDPISEFINANAEMKILALAFIAMIGALLVLDALGVNSGVEVLDMHMEKLMVYFAMVFSVVLELLQLRRKANVAKRDAELARKPGAEGAASATVGRSAK